jgi:tRNA-specific 2-thiouridylase
MSGGVDSSVAALLLAERGYRVSGIAMRIFDASSPVGAASGHACYGPEEEDDLEAARTVCRKLGVPFYVIDLRKEFRSHVIEYFRSAYLAGKTPNPCALCNYKLKFGFLLEEARASGVEFERFATGHYARLGRSAGRFLLKRAVDRSKDQSYFLFSLTQEQLSGTLFPLGGLTKLQVREIARSAGLNTAERAESQDFVSGEYGSFFSKSEVKEGPIEDRQGRVLGTHRGIVHYTVGQRRGLGIALGAPMYVSRIDARANRIIVEGREGLFSQGLVVGGLNLISVDALRGPMRVQAKIRLQHRPAEALLIPNEGSDAMVIFDRPQRAVAPGQSAVFYQADTVVGGGTIERAIKAGPTVTRP